MVGVSFLSPALFTMNCGYVYAQGLIARWWMEPNVVLFKRKCVLFYWEVKMSDTSLVLSKLVQSSYLMESATTTDILPETLIPKH